MMETTVLSELKTLVCWLRSTGSSSMADLTMLKEAEKEYKHADWVHTKLGCKTFRSSVVSMILQQKLEWTYTRGYKQDALDARQDCLGFEDGVYDFETGELVRGDAAQEYMLSKTVGYKYEDVKRVALNETTMAEFEHFFEQIHGRADVRAYLLQRFRNAARKLNGQKVLVHYNTSTSNGQTTFFDLVSMTFGATCETACVPGLFVPKTPTSRAPPSRVVVYEEPTRRAELSATFLKALMRRNTMVNLQWSRDPDVANMDVETSRLLTCVPYESTFVYVGSPLLEDADVVYVVDKGVHRNFDTWRLCFMHKILFG
jgi:phage/plasmid-associated DNA primase